MVGLTQRLSRAAQNGQVREHRAIEPEPTPGKTKKIAKGVGRCAKDDGDRVGQQPMGGGRGQENEDRGATRFR